MKKKAADLIDVKSMVTLTLTIVFAYLAIVGKISGTEFLTIFTMIMAFYFGTQAVKKPASEDTKEEGESTGDIK